MVYRVGDLGMVHGAHRLLNKSRNSSAYGIIKPKMGTHKFAGFTIIETMLFLGISSVLIVALIASTGNSVNIQRYRDSAESFKQVLQQQYADVISTQNGRTANWTCDSSAKATQTGSPGEGVGQSDCMLIGKYVRVENSQISIYRVLAYKNAPALGNDVSSLDNSYTLNISPTEQDNSTLEWGSQITWPVRVNNAANPQPQSPRRFGMLVVRSPDSGQVYTFTASDSDVPDVANIGPATFKNMIASGNTIPGQGAQTLCIDSGGFLSNNDRAVYIDSFASRSSAVELRTNDFMAGLGTQC